MTVVDGPIPSSAPVGVVPDGLQIERNIRPTRQERNGYRRQGVAYRPRPHGESGFSFVSGAAQADQIIVLGPRQNRLAPDSNRVGAATKQVNLQQVRGATQNIATFSRYGSIPGNGDGI